MPHYYARVDLGELVGTFVGTILDSGVSGQLLEGAKAETSPLVSATLSGNHRMSVGKLFEICTTPT